MNSPVGSIPQRWYSKLKRGAVEAMAAKFTCNIPSTSKIAGHRISTHPGSACRIVGTQVPRLAPDSCFRFVKCSKPLLIRSFSCWSCDAVSVKPEPNPNARFNVRASILKSVHCSNIGTAEREQIDAAKAKNESEGKYPNETETDAEK